MKNSTFSIPFTLAIILGISFITYGQQITTWKGGTPGRTNDWNCPKNWQENKVPDAFSDVIIPDVTTTTFALPVIRSGQYEINSLWMDTKASLTIEAEAMLAVNFYFFNPVESNLSVRGTLILPEESNRGTGTVANTGNTIQ